MAEEIERTDIVLEGQTATWDIHLEGEIQGLYTGTFRFRCFLNPIQQLAAGREHRELLGKNPTLASDREDQIAWSLSQLRQRIVSAPPFWTANGSPGDIPDENVLAAVIDASIASQDKYMKQIRKKKEEAINKAKEIAEKMASVKAAIPIKEEDEIED